MYQRILVPLDGSATAERGLREAINLAAGTDAGLLLLHVVDDYPSLVGITSITCFDEMMKGLRRKGLDVLAGARKAAESASLHVETFLRGVNGKPMEQVIVEQAVEHSCDLVVMGTHGRGGFDRIAMGSVAEGVTRTCPVPVLLVGAAPACGSSAGSAS